MSRNVTAGAASSDTRSDGAAVPARAVEIVDYWLGDSVDGPDLAFAHRARWYHGGPDLDAEIVDRFASDVARALAQELDDWSATPTGALALVILLDQFTRTVHRGSAAAFSGDAKAHAVADAAVEAGHNRVLPVPGRIFLYHPYHHAEDLGAQDRVLDLLAGIKHDVAPHWHPYVDRSIKGFGRHRDIVARFGRFPHRNAALGRESTAEEIAYLEDGADRFGQ